jgi:drug/metabolite transporter (DMT)-like permease
MAPLAIVLLLASAALHAAWNLRGKGCRAGLAGYAGAELAMALVMVPLWPWALTQLCRAPRSALVLIATSCACQGLYYLGLSRAYAAGDLGVAYPLVRTLPVLLLAGVGILTATTPPGIGSLLGIALITAGAGALSLRRSQGGDGRRQAVAVAVTVILVAGYTTLDARSLPAIRAATGLGPLATAAAVVPFMALGNGLCALLAAATLPAERQRIRELRGAASLGTALMGLGIWGSYGLALAAMALDVPVATVAGLRLVSVPLGFLVAVVRFSEPLSAPRIGGIAGMVLGVLLLTRH